MIKVIYSFHTDISLKQNKDRDIGLLDNSWIILRQ